MASSRSNRAGRTCPGCGEEKVVSSKEALLVFPHIGQWGVPKDIIENEAEKVCSLCHAVKIGGEWERIETVGNRAYELYQASSSRTKDFSDFKEKLTAGPGIESEEREKKQADDAEGW